MVLNSRAALMTFMYTTYGGYSHAVTMQAVDKHFIPCTGLF